MVVHQQYAGRPDGQLLIHLPNVGATKEYMCPLVGHTGKCEEGRQELLLILPMHLSVR